MSDYFLITLDELNGLAPPTVDKKRMEILLNVMQRKYIEKTFLQYAAGGIGSIIQSLDEMTEPDPKKRGPVKK